MLVLRVLPRLGNHACAYECVPGSGWLMTLRLGLYVVHHVMMGSWRRLVACRPTPINVEYSSGAVLTLTVTEAIAMPQLKSFGVFRPCASK